MAASADEIAGAKRHVDAILAQGGRRGSPTTDAYVVAYPDDPKCRKQAARSKLLVNGTVMEYRREREAALVTEADIAATLATIMQANVQDYVGRDGGLRTGLTRLQMVAVRRTDPVELRDPIVAADKLGTLLDRQRRRRELAGAAESGTLSPDATALALAVQQLGLDAHEVDEFSKMLQAAASGERERSVVVRALALAVRIAEATRPELAKLERFLEAL